MTQKNGHPGHPQTQGKVERCHQTLKRWLARRPLPATLADLQPTRSGSAGGSGYWISTRVWSVRCAS
ncbi:integrase core domain-containing protein [Mycobacterium sp. 155]|uniref:integrase core domain-containing protein n=1 Tax=Mycobacterium sp. 155 TaxID=1157943 RepID=UPI00351007CA